MKSDECTAVDGKRGAVMITALSILASMVAMLVLVSVDVAQAKKLRRSEVPGSPVSATGKLLGWNARDGSEWAPRQDMSQAGILFGVAQAGQIGDMQFWRDVALRTRAAAPEVQFVGFCASRGGCSPSMEEDLVVLLSAMDPLQVHALRVGVREGLAFPFRGSQVLGALPIQADKAAFATTIARIAK
jgi:hypothetical protein